MRSIAARSPFAMACTRCLRTAALPAVGIGAAALVLGRWAAPTAAEQSAPGAATPWLVLSVLVVAATVSATAIVLWPTFAAGRPGAEVVQRLQRGPWRGCGAVLAGALAAQFLLALPLTTLLARGLGAPAVARAHLEAVPVAGPVLDRQSPQLELRLPRAVTAAAVELRPLAAMPTGALLASRVRVLLDGAPIGDVVAFDQTGQLACLEFPPRPVQVIGLALVEGNVPLFFPHGSATVVADAAHDGMMNGVRAALLTMLPVFVALAFACLCGAVAAAPTVLTVASALLLLTTVGGVGPASASLLQLMRGRWIATEAVFGAALPSLAAGSAAMIAAMLLRRRPRA